MSAQAARERKKARMDELERQLTILTERLRRSERENFCLRDRLAQYEPAEPILFDQMYSQTFKQLPNQSESDELKWTNQNPFNQIDYFPPQPFSPQLHHYLSTNQDSKNCSPTSSFYSE